MVFAKTGQVFLWRLLQKFDFVVKLLILDICMLGSLQNQMWWVIAWIWHRNTIECENFHPTVMRIHIVKYIFHFIFGYVILFWVSRSSLSFLLYFKIKFPSIHLMNFLKDLIHFLFCQNLSWKIKLKIRGWKHVCTILRR